MILRNLLLWSVMIFGALGLSWQLFPKELPEHAPGFSAEAVFDPSFRETLDRVNEAFRREWQDYGIVPAGRAPELQIARRVSLGLTGSIPSLQEIRQFEAREGPDRIAWWTQGLLQDRRSADYLAERLTRAYVGTEDGPFLFFRRRRFRLWLSDQLMANRPYDELVRELIAGQGLWTDNPAVNFISFTIDPPNEKGPDPERLGARVARAFLGIRLDCAQCHDHPFQDWKQSDFQGLAAFFARTKHGMSGIYDAASGVHAIEDRKTLRKTAVPPAVPYLPELRPHEGTWRQQLAAWVTSPQNPYFAQAAVNRMWAILLGKPLVEPVDDLYAAPRRPEALEILAQDFRQHGHDLRRLIQLIVNSEVFQLDSAADHELTEAHDLLWAAFPLTRLRPEQVIGSIVQASSPTTIGADSHIFTQLLKFVNETDFIKRYGDQAGEDEFVAGNSTIPQRLLMMNGEIVHERTRPGLFAGTTRIAMMAPSNGKAVEVAFLTVLTRRPTAEELEYFTRRLDGYVPEELLPRDPEDARKFRAAAVPDRNGRLQDLFWTLINTTEFSWNH
jgi:hypothetical protein